MSSECFVGSYHVSGLKFGCQGPHSRKRERFLSACAAAIALAVATAFSVGAAQGAEERPPCTEDAILCSTRQARCPATAGDGSETAGTVSRIDKVRTTLAKILPQVTRFRRVGLITYGPGVWNHVHLDLAPAENAAGRIINQEP